MTSAKLLGYLRNCFWLLVPILVFNLLYASQLPAAYQAGVFWKQIPKAIAIPENLFRALVMILPVFMRLSVSSSRQRFGLGLYLLGFLLYLASWAALIAAPKSPWSTSVIGFLAPAFAPGLWLAAIGLIGSEPLLPKLPLKPWMYWTLSVLFLCFHNLHAATVYSRGV
jgi:hypothetical protein